MVIYQYPQGLIETAQVHQVGSPFETGSIAQADLGLWTNNYSARWGAATSYINCGDYQGLSGTTQFVISMRVKLDATGATYSLMGKWTPATQFIIQAAAGKIGFRVFTTTTRLVTTSAVIITPNIWHHVVCVLDIPNAVTADRMRIYVDGVRYAATGGFPGIAEVVATNNGILYIGGHYSGSSSNLQQAYVGEPTIWSNQDADQAAIDSMSDALGYAIDPNRTQLGQPTSYWPAVDIVGTLVPDRYGSDDGTISGNVARIHLADHHWDQVATYFDGAAEYVDCGNNNEIDGDTKCTWWGLIRVDSAWPGSDKVWISKTALNQCKFYFHLRNNGVMRFQIATSLTTTMNLVLPAGRFVADMWYAIGVVFDGSLASTARLKIYIDAVPATDGVYSTDPPAALTGANVANFQLGAVGGSAVYPAGWMGPTAIWPGVAATEDQLEELMEDGRPKAWELTEMGQPTLGWRMGDGAGGAIPDVGSYGLATGVLSGGMGTDSYDGYPLPFDLDYRSFKSIRADDSLIQATNNIDVLNGATTFSWGSWIKVTAWPGGGELHNLSSVYYGLVPSEGQFIFYIGSGGTTRWYIWDGPAATWKYIYKTSAMWVSGAWAMVGYTFNAGVVTLHVNGISQAVPAWSGGAAPTSINTRTANAPLELGAVQLTANRGFNGFLKDTFIHEGIAYTTADWLACYNNGRPIDMAVDGPNGLPHVYYKMDPITLSAYPNILDSGQQGAHGLFRQCEEDRNIVKDYPGIL